MEDTFEIPVLYNGNELHFDAQLVQAGYVHKILVDVNGHHVSVEKDDEENYRAVLVNVEAENKIDKGLVEAIVESIEVLLK